MQVNDIYVIDPKTYKSYQKNKRQEFKTLVLISIIKILMMILLVVVGYLSYKVLNKKGYLSETSTPKTYQNISPEGVYVEVLAQKMQGESSLVLPPSKTKEEVVTLSSTYVEKMKMALNQGL